MEINQDAAIGVNVIIDSICKNNSFLIKKADENDITKIDVLMKNVYENLENKNFFVCDDLTYIREHISEHGFAVVAENSDGECIGSFLVHIPGMNEENLGHDIDLNENELPYVAHMESTVVHPDFRGQGLQGKMLTLAEELIDSKHFYYLMATVDPDNQASLHTFLKHGYQIRKIKKKYGGLNRCILYKKL